ncbi:sodium-dependent glucose transporter 1C-like isoform X2 [Folsomia candida]|uniref:sodium-dependent glucose transporter 1C-like isoform X2 n=1 Tax=Folsomia candida TaxID=158441 RepID=UPI001604B392|nr:sodium-dependent glucose transporter 1C-like isoform X2 [Folsomia candida]
MYLCCGNSSLLLIGCAFNLFSPLLVQLSEKYETDIGSMSNIFVVLTLTYLCGAMLGGIMYEKLIRRQYGVVIAFSGISLSLFVTPYCPTITYLFVSVGFLGLSCGAYDTAQTVWIMEMWQSKSGPFIQAQHFCFALGSNLPSLLTRPFLPDSTSSDVISEANTGTDYSSSSKIPFTIVGALALMNVLYELFLLTGYPYVVPERECSDTDAHKISGNDNGNNNGNKISLPQPDALLKTQSESDNNVGSNSRKILLVTLSGLFLGFYQGMEMCTLQFVPTLAQFGSVNKLSGAEAALILTGLTGAFAIGRGIGILITLKVSPQIILSFNALLVIVGNVTLLMWAYLGLSTKILWCACITLGFGFSTLYASFCSFMERHLVFTDFVGCVMLVSGSLVGMAYPAIVGKLVEQHPEVVTYTNFCSVLLCSLAFIAAYIVTKKSTRVK